MDSILFLILAALYLVLLGWGIILLMRDAKPGLRYLLLVVTAGLVWDNVLIGLGRWIGEGALLEHLSLTRFWTHALFTPLLTLVAYDLIVRAGSGWARSTFARAAAWVFTLALVVLELLYETIGTSLEAVYEYGALRYTAADSSGPPIMVILVLIPLFTAGIVLWRRRKSPWLFIGTLLMLVGSAIELPIESSAATNVFELLLMTSLWISVHQARRWVRPLAR
ncbi:hypothetical protein [Paenibacillus sp. 1P07SE]|uniref:hypothetical protein n=1 Tax=Paenibacillus sp. 1P07SE TaxID=3132209 RepID=UPI0039A5BBFC